MKHTKLPWVKDYGGTIGHIKSVSKNGEKTPTVLRYDIGVSLGYPLFSEAEMNANAEFICRAVNSHYELLEACQIVHDILIEESQEVWSYEIRILLDAIQKAEG